MDKLESVLYYETQKILWDFQIQTDLLIPARKPHLVIISKKKKENLPFCGFFCPGGP